MLATLDLCAYSFSGMKMNRRSIAGVLILLLVLGPLQVQQAFACSMMETTFHGHCCCDQDNACQDIDCDEDAASLHDSCCNESIELDVNYEAADHAKTIKSPQILSSVDPPAQLLVLNYKLFQINSTILRTTYLLLRPISWGLAPISSHNVYGFRSNLL